MIWGTDATSAGVRGLRPSVVLGLPAVLEGGRWLGRGLTGAWAGVGVVAGSGWVAAFGGAMMSAPEERWRRVPWELFCVVGVRPGWRIRRRWPR